MSADYEPDQIQDYGVYPWTHDPHRCGTAPFVPQIVNGEQNSCGSYCDYFDEKGCNRYLPNYPDDYYLLNHIKEGGSCKDFKDCRGVNPAWQRPLEPLAKKVTCEPFGMYTSTDAFTKMLYIALLVLLGMCLFKKK